MLTYLFTVIQSTKQNYTTLNRDTAFIHAHQPHISNNTYSTRSFPVFFPNNLKRKTFFLYNYCLDLKFRRRWTFSTRWSQMKNKTVKLFEGLKKKKGW